MKTTFASSSLPALLVALAACGGAAEVARAPETPKQVAPAPDAGDAILVTPGTLREAPPISGTPKEFSFPKPARKTLANGLEVATIELHALPIVQLRVLVRAGAGYGSAPGIAAFTAQMLKDGGTKTMTSAKLLERVEGLGATLGVDTSFDGTTVSIGVTKDHLAEAMKILAEVVTLPRWDETELKKLRDRETDEAKEKARGSGAWMATRVVFRELYNESNPYAAYDLVPSEIAKIAMPKLQDFHKKFYVPKNAKLIVAGDVDATAVAKAADEAFGAWRGGDAPKVDFPPAIPPARVRIILADRPKSAQSDIYVAGVAPPRTSPQWPQIRVATQILGGGPASRLFLDVREQRSLAYTTRASIFELANGQQPLIAYAGTQTAKTGLALAGLLENLAKMQKQEVTTPETETARRNISDTFAIRMETVGAIADMLVQQEIFRLPDGYRDSYRASVRAVDARLATSTASKLYAPERALIVVAGDAERIGPMLAHFGDVTVVDPEAELKTVRTLPANPGAPLEVK